MKTTKTALMAMALVVMGTQVSKADWISNAASRLENSVRVEAGRASRSVQRAHAMNYRVRIINPTNSTIFYRFEGAPQALPPRTVRTHSGTKAGRPGVSFGNGRRQTVSYGLDGNRTFTFQWKYNVLDLYRK